MERGGFIVTFATFAVMFFGSAAFLSIFGILDKYASAKWLEESKRGDME